MCYAHLTQKQRYQIQELVEAPTPVRLIARKLGVHRSTVYRELRRGADRHQRYRADCAGRAAQRRRRRCAANAPRKPAALWRGVARLLKRDWAPEQIRGRSLVLGKPAVSVPAIYAFIGRRRGLRRHLRYVPRRDQRLSSPLSWRNRSAKRPSIHDRPAEALTRELPGHWEGDTMRGTSRNKRQLLTLVERKSRYLVALLPRQGAQPSAQIAQSTLQGLRRLPRRSITFDNGPEFACYEDIKRSLRCPVYFADAHSPNQRATCENTIGLIRQYLPKGIDLSRVTHAYIRRIVSRLNHRPRKCLGYRTPFEVLFNKPPVALRT
jgi:IS30 family transposase